MSKTIKIWVVTESQIDYDDYPIGGGKTILVTADKERAEAEGSWDKSKWTIPHSPIGRVSRRREEFLVEDVPE